MKCGPALAFKLTPPTTRPQYQLAEFPRAGFLGVGQGACYWNGVDGSRRSTIIIRVGFPARGLMGQCRHFRSQQVGKHPLIRSSRFHCVQRL